MYNRGRSQQRHVAIAPLAHVGYYKLVVTSATYLAPVDRKHNTEHGSGEGASVLHDVYLIPSVSLTVTETAEVGSSGWVFRETLVCGDFRE